MFCHQVKIKLDRKDDDIQIRPLGDIHIGNLGCDLEEFKKSVKWVASNHNHYTIGMGDYIDNVMAWANGGVDKRWNPGRRMCNGQTNVVLPASAISISP